jgi:SAM-dependent methyltransferase
MFNPLFCQITTRILGVSLFPLVIWVLVSNSYAGKLEDTFVSAKLIREAIALQEQVKDLDQVLKFIKSRNPALTKAQLEMVQKITAHGDATIEKGLEHDPSFQQLCRAATIVTTSTSTWMELNGNTPFHQYVLDSVHVGANVLDIGSSTGVNLRKIVEKGGNAFAVDLEPEQHAILIKNLDLKYLDQVHVFLGKFPEEIELDSDFFDTVLLGQVIHFMNPSQLQITFQQSYKALKKSGRLLLSTNSVHSSPFAEFFEHYTTETKEKLHGSEVGFVFPTFIPNYSDIFELNVSSTIHPQDFDLTVHNLKYAGFRILDQHFFSIFTSEEGELVPEVLTESSSNMFSLVAEKP